METLHFIVILLMIFYFIFGNKVVSKVNQFVKIYPKIIAAAVGILTLVNADSLLNNSHTPTFLNQKQKTNNNKKENRKVSETLKKTVASDQGWRCGHCNQMLNASFEVDHINPLYKNGNNDRNNLMALCRNCHGLKTINDKLYI